MIVMIIASRYILPLLILLKGFMTVQHDRNLEKIVTLAIIAPIITLGIELQRLFRISSSEAANLNQLTKIIVLFCLILLVYCCYLLLNIHIKIKITASSS